MFGSTARLAVTFGLAVVVLGVAAAPGRAGTYDVPVCDEADGENNSWKRWNNASAYATSERCPSQGSDAGGLYVTTGSSGSTSRGSGDGWRFTAPDDTTLKSLDFNVTWRRKDNFDAILATDKSILRFYPRTGESGNFARESGDGVGLNGAKYVQTQVSCGAPSSCSLNEDFGALALRGATVEVEDKTEPELDARGGTLSPGGAPTQRGPASVRFDATDNTGIKSARLLIDGNEVDSESYSIDATRPAPGDNQFDRTLVVDTRDLSEGAHTAQVRVLDAADNETTYEKAIVVDNVSDSGEDGGEAGVNSGVGDGSGGGSGRSGGSNGGGGSSGGGPGGSGGGPGIAPAPLGLDTVSLATSRRAVRNGRSVLFTGRVLDGGLPAAGVLVAVQAKVGRKWVTFKIVRTDALGNFASRYRFKRTRGSRRYQFRAHVAAQGTLNTIDSLSRLVRVSPRAR